MNYLISIIVPCYNQQNFIQQCLQSIQQQTYTQWQCIIINDGSTDASEQVIQKTIAADERFVYINQKNAGVSAARNAGLAAATGEYIAFLDGDDWWDVQFLEKMYRLNAELVFCNCQLYFADTKRIVERQPDVSTQKISYEQFLKNWEIQFSPAIHSALVKRKLLTSFQFNINLSTWEDLEYWLHILNQNPNSATTHEVLCTYRKHSASSSSKFESSLESLKKTHKYFLEKLPVEDRLLYVDLIINYYSLVLRTINKDKIQFQKSWGYRLNRLSIFIVSLKNRIMP